MMKDFCQIWSSYFVCHDCHQVCIVAIIIIIAIILILLIHIVLVVVVVVVRVVVNIDIINDIIYSAEKICSIIWKIKHTENTIIYLNVIEGNK